MLLFLHCSKRFILSVSHWATLSSYCCCCHKIQYNIVLAAFATAYQISFTLLHTGPHRLSSAAAAVSHSSTCHSSRFHFNMPDLAPRSLPSPEDRLFQFSSCQAIIFVYLAFVPWEALLRPILKWMPSNSNLIRRLLVDLAQHKKSLKG